MDVNIDLDEIVKTNYNDIKNGNYVWSDEEVNAVYKLAHYILNSLHCPKDEIDDMLQELVLHFFSHIIYMFDIDKGIRLSTYTSRAFINKYLIKLRKKKFDTISIDKIVCTNSDGDELKLKDILRDESDLDNKIQEVKEAVIERFKELNINNPIVLEYYFDENKPTMQEIADRYGYSQGGISRKIAKAIKKAKKDPIVKELLA